MPSSSMSSWADCPQPSATRFFFSSIHFIKPSAPTQAWQKRTFIPYDSLPRRRFKEVPMSTLTLTVTRRPLVGSEITGTDFLYLSDDIDTVSFSKPVPPVPTGADDD